MRHIRFLSLLAIGATLLTVSITGAEEPPRPQPSVDGSYDFIYMTDVHNYLEGTPQTSLRNTCKRLLEDGAGGFLITGGDYDNFPETRSIMERELFAPLRQRGVDLPWYALVGNHDPEGTANEPARNNDGSGRNLKGIMAQNARMPYIVNHGPPERSNLIDYGLDGAKYTTFSFDYGDGHFVVLDLYSAQTRDNRRKGQADKRLVDWVEADLKATKRKRIFVFGHEPFKEYSGIAFPGEEEAPIKPDLLMAGERDRLWNVLKADPRVIAYVCGHSHRFGMVRDGALWQVALGQEWTAFRMFGRFMVGPDSVTVRVYRWVDGAHQFEDHVLREGAP